MPPASPILSHYIWETAIFFSTQLIDQKEKELKKNGELDMLSAFTPQNYWVIVSDSNLYFLLANFQSVPFLYKFVLLLLMFFFSIDKKEAC